MQLNAMRPKHGAKLVQLRDLLEDRGWRSALPPAFPDSVLLSLASDFRRIEVGFAPNSTPTAEDGPSLAAAIYVVMNLLMSHPARPGHGDVLQLSEEALAHAIQIYQIGLEREIVTRITGVAALKDAESLVGDLLRCVDERH